HVIGPESGKYACELRLQPDSRMERAFRIADSNTRPSLAAEDLAAVAAHASVLYVLSGQYGPGEAAQTAHLMLLLGCTLLDAGGIAIKCESSGLAHGAQRWRDLAYHAGEQLAGLQTNDEDAKELARYGF